MIKNHEVYHPLYNDKDHFIILVTGGRGSGKSFGVGTFAERLTFEVKKRGLPDGTAERLVHNILYTRYTMASAAISVIPEFLEKVELDGTQQYFHATKTDITNMYTGAKIMFRGIKTSSGNQTAKLKSIHGITTFICDEAEEWTSEREFETISLSIRQQGIQNRVIVIMNPTDSNHFIYQKYLKDTHRLEYYDGFPVQISTHPNVLHIHTTWLDNKENLSEEFVKSAIDMKERNPERYAHIFMGHWDDVAEGAVFKNWGIVNEFPENAKKVAKGLDFGYTCFVGDTLITTKRGQIPISQITTDDYVLTRKGYRKVLRKFNNGIKRVVEQELAIGSHKITICATPNHLFNVDIGIWRQFRNLTVGDKLCTLSSLMEKNTSDDLTANIPTISTVSGASAFCTERYTNTLWGQSRKGTSFTTWIKTRLTMMFQTLCKSLYPNTTDFIARISRITRPKNTLYASASQKTIGKNAEISSRINWRWKHAFVNIVGKSLPLLTLIKGFAQKSAITSGNTTLPNSELNLSVNGVGANSLGINTSDRNVVETSAPISYLAINKISKKREFEAEVYDLEIEGVHEYFANGILVHNCDPSACVRCGIVGNDLYLDEQFYETGMGLKQLISTLSQDGDFVYADSADPRLIDEIALGGVIIYPVSKPAGSIIAGIEKMKSFDNIFVTKRSINLQEELRNYVWAQDKFGNYINTPEDKFNHCFTADTSITTNRGCISMGEIKVGDKVATSNGYRKVQKKFNNGRKKIICVRLSFDGFSIELKGTSDHKIKTDRGWIKLQDLKVGDALFLCKNSTARHTIYTKEKDTTPEDAIVCTQMYGNSTTEKFPRVSTFTTLTGIPKTTLSRIWNFLMEQNISRYICKHLLKARAAFKFLGNEWTTPESLLPNGTALLMDSNGIDDTVKRPQEKSNNRSSSANGVETPLCQSPTERIDFAVMDAGQERDTTQALIMRCASASNVETNLSQTNTPAPNTAQEDAVDYTVQKQEIIAIEILKEDFANVYDLQVEETHEYFANGILVHNCIDAVRYYITGCILGKIVKPKNVRKSDLGIF